jgi:O-antigen ligase
MTPAKRLAATPLQDRAAALPAFLRAQQPQPKPAGRVTPMPTPLIDRPMTTAQWVELGVLVFCIMVMTGAFVTLIHPELGDRPTSVQADPLPEDGYPELRALQLPPYIALALLICLHPRNFIQTVRANLVHLILPALAIVSIVWSNDPAVTFRRSFAFLVPTVFALYLASRYTERGVVRVLFFAVLGCLALSAAYVVLMPSVGIMQYEMPGIWRGAFTHKNVLGPMVLHTGVFAVGAWIHRVIKTRTLMAVVLATCVMVVGSRSTTSLVGFLALIYALPLFAIGKIDGRWLAVYACLTLAVAAGMVPFIRDLGEIMEAFGKDASLTGRLPLWGYVLAFASERFMFGYGYGAFWAVGDSPGEIIRGLVGWNPPHAHNALLQSLCDLGLLGFTALVLTLSVTVTRAVRRAAGALSGTDVFPLMALWILLVLSVSEARLVEPNSIDWLIYMSIAAAMVRIRPVPQVQDNAPEMAAAGPRP